jgi:archaellum component FlaD/FlaE
MDKTTHFFGTSVFGQLISLINSNFITDSAKSCNSDGYVKKFTTKDHLISMLFVHLPNALHLGKFQVQ